MSESPASSGVCPSCGVALPSDTTDGLCARCLLAEAMVPTGVGPEAAEPRTTLALEELAPHFPQLEIIECLGRGGMGVVYKARQKSLNRLVALKLLAPERVGDAQFAARFTREAQALAALNHPNIVTIYDFGQAGGFYFLLMEFVDGVNLRQLLRKRRLAPEAALAIVPPLCDALQLAHDRGIIHRDIKPENVLLDREGRVKIADFGIAKMLAHTEAGADGAEIAAPDGATQAAVGTPGYSAPEQRLQPQRVDSRADIYSLGVVFYEMLTGERPDSRLEPPSKKVPMDARLDAIVLRALEEVPQQRYQQISEMKTMVETIAAAKPNVSKDQPANQPMNTTPDKRRWIWTIVVAIAIAVAGGGWAIVRLAGPPPPPLPFWSVSFSPDGRTIVTSGGPAGRPPGGLPGELVFWNADSGRKHIIRHQGSVRRAIWAADGSFIAIGDLSGSTQVVKPFTGRPIQNFSPPNDLLNGVALSRDGSLIAVAGFGGSISLWDRSGHERRAFHYDQDQFVDAAMSPDGQNLVVTTKGGQALLFDLSQAAEPVVLRACDDNQNAESVAFAPNSQTFATGAQNRLRAWGTRDGRRLWGETTPAVICGVAYSPDGKFIATVDADGQLTLYEPDSGETITSTLAHNSAIFGLAISPDGKRIATAGRDDLTLKVWSAPSLQLLKTFHR